MMSIEWSQTEKYLGNIKPVEGGFTKAKRGIVELPDGSLFVKIGVDETTNKWIKREIEIYQILQKHGYRHSPRLLSVKDDLTAFGIEAMEKEDGWDWSSVWSSDRLSKTLEAMDDLALIIPERDEKNILGSDNGLENENGWEALDRNSELQKLLLERIDFLSSNKIMALSQTNSGYVFENTTLVHNDVRADNCAWNQTRKAVALVDWNWTQLGDRRIDVNAVLVDVAMSGVDVFNLQKSRLDKNALVWLAGYWFKSAMTKLLDSSELSSLIDFQIRSGIIAMKLLFKL